MTPEGRVKAKVKKILNAYSVYYEMPVPTGFGKSGLDFVCCVAGMYLSIETKAGTNEPTPRQQQTIDDIRSAGGMALVIRDDAGCEVLEAWIKTVLAFQKSTELS